MTPAVVQIITALIGGTVGVFATFFLQSVKDWHDGRKDEAQKIAEKMAHAKAEKRRWQQEYDYLRAWILAQNALSDIQLAKMPKPPSRDD